MESRSCTRCLRDSVHIGSQYPSMTTMALCPLPCSNERSITLSRSTLCLTHELLSVKYMVTFFASVRKQRDAIRVALLSHFRLSSPHVRIEWICDGVKKSGLNCALHFTRVGPRNSSRNRRTRFTQRFGIDSRSYSSKYVLVFPSGEL